MARSRLKGRGEAPPAYRAQASTLNILSFLTLFLVCPITHYLALVPSLSFVIFINIFLVVLRP